MEEDDDWGPLHATRDGGTSGRFLRLTPYDRPKRRALWMQWVRDERSEWLYTTASVGVPRCVTLRAGREGDDAELTLREGDVLTAALLDALADLMLTVRFGLGDVEERLEAAEKTGGGESTADPA